MNDKFKALFIAFSLVTLLAGVTFAFAGAGNVGGGGIPATGYATTSINLSGVTDTIQDLFIELIPLIAIMSILGGLLSALPKMFKFNMN